MDVGTSTANEESKPVIGQFHAVPFRPQATLQNAPREYDAKKRLVVIGLSYRAVLFTELCRIQDVL